MKVSYNDSAYIRFGGNYQIVSVALQYSGSTAMSSTRSVMGAWGKKVHTSDKKRKIRESSASGGRAFLMAWEHLVLRALTGTPME
jgi:hypothetical protein